MWSATSGGGHELRKYGKNGSRYTQGGDLPAGQMPEVERHLGECAGCQVFASGLKETLRGAAGGAWSLPAEAHFAAVRARVLAEVERRRFSVWLRVLAWSTVAAGILVMVGLARLYRPVPPPPGGGAGSPAGAHGIAGLRSASQRAGAQAVRRPAAVATEAVTIKLMTDNPDVVIYWIADRKGE